MRDYRGTLAGLVVGAFGGFSAALFGALIGFLIDLIRAELRANRLAVRFLDSGEAPESFPRTFVLACALYARLRASGGPGPTDPGVPASLVDRLRPLLAGRVPRRLVERLAATAVEHPGPGDDRFAEWFAACAPVEHRERAFRAVWEELERSADAAQARETIHRLARLAGLDEGFIARELVVRPSLDAEACRVLGVPRDASPYEIRAAYRRLAAQFHPDTAGGLTGEQLRATEEAFVRIQAAYEKLNGRQS